MLAGQDRGQGGEAVSRVARGLSRRRMKRHLAAFAAGAGVMPI